MRQPATSPARFARAFVLLLCVSAAAHATARQDSGLAGVWQTGDAAAPLVLVLAADGTGKLDGAAIKYVIRGGKLVVDEDGVVNAYDFKLGGDSLTLSGGDLEEPLAFRRKGAARGIGARRNETAAAQARGRAGAPGRDAEESGGGGGGLVGRWQSSEATVQINDDGTLVLDGQTYRYSVEGGVITLAGGVVPMRFPFRLSGDTLNVQVGDESVVYRRVSGGGAARGGGGGHPPELFGKWCYMANVNAGGGGGRISNRCFTLHEDGTYEYYAETSSSGPVASSASQESDTGTWSATATTITRNSRTLGTETYTLEKRNHPRTGDPMLVLDGDAYVTYARRTPWP